MTLAGRRCINQGFQRGNKPRITEKLTKSWAGKTLKPTPKRQEDAKSDKALITELILLFEKHWEEDQF